MGTFKDTKGREWKIALNVWVARQVRDRVGVDLVNSNAVDVLLTQFKDDVALFCDVLYVMAHENAEGELRGVTDDDFGRSLDSDSIEEGVRVFLQALRDFSPSRGRPLVAMLLDEFNAEIKRADSRADEALKVAAAQRKTATSGSTSSTSQESPGSSHGSTPSES